MKGGDYSPPFNSIVEQIINNAHAFPESLMETVYQVFVSSTYADLKDERRRVSETLAKAGYIPAGMEMFPATDQQQFEFIKRVINRCD